MLTKHEPHDDDDLTILCEYKPAKQEFVRIHCNTSEKVTEIALEDEQLKLEDLRDMFPSAKALRLEGATNILWKCRYEKFLKPPNGWEAYKVYVILNETFQSDVSISLPSLNTTLITSMRSQEVSSLADSSLYQNTSQHSLNDLNLSTPPVNTHSFSDDNKILFLRFSVNSFDELFAMQQFSPPNDLHIQDFYQYRQRICELYQNTMISLGPEAFNLSTLYRINKETFNTRTLCFLNSLRLDSCQLCNINFENCTLAFRHWCSIQHAENSLKITKMEAKEIKEILEFTRSTDIFDSTLSKERSRSRRSRSRTLGTLNDAATPCRSRTRGRSTVTEARKPRGRTSNVEIVITENPSINDLLDSFDTVPNGLRLKSHFRVHSEKNVKLFKSFREFAIEHMKSLLITNRTHKTLMFSLFQVFKSLDIVKSFEGPSKTCRVCGGVWLTLEHLLSQLHIQQYQQHSTEFPPELMSIKEALSQPEVFKSLNSENAPPPAKRRKV